MLLDTVTRSLTLNITEGITANNLTWYAKYVDKAIERVTPNSNLGVIAGDVTPVTAVAAPSFANGNVSREIEELIVYNADTVTHTVLVAIVDGANTFTLIAQQLAKGTSLTYNQFAGWAA